MDIQQQTKNVAAQGRFGDSMLLHVNPAEVKGLASAVPLTVNPETGQPEAFLPFLAPMLGSMLGGSLLTGATLGGLTAASGLSAAAAAGIGAGLATYAQTGGSGSKALLSGLTAGMGAKALNTAAQGVPTEVITSTPTPTVDPSFVGPALPTPPPVTTTLPAITPQTSLMDTGSRIFSGGFDEGMKNLAGAAMTPSGMVAGTAAGTAGVIQSQEEFERQMAQMGLDEEERKRKMYEMYPEQIPMASGGRTGFQPGGQTGEDYPIEDVYIDNYNSGQNPYSYNTGGYNFSGGYSGGNNNSYNNPYQNSFNVFNTPRQRRTRPIGRGFMPGFMPEYSYFENMNPSATSLGYDPLGNFQNPQSYQGGYSQPSRGRGGLFGGAFGRSRGIQPMPPGGGFRYEGGPGYTPPPPMFGGYGNPFMQSPSYQGFYGVPQMQQTLNPYARFTQQPMPYQPYQPYVPPVETPPDDDGTPPDDGGGTGGGGTGGGTGGGGTPPIDPPIDIPGDGLGRKGAVTNPNPIAPPDDFVNPIVNPPVGGPVEPPITPPITMPPMPPSIGRPGEPFIGRPGEPPVDYPGKPGFYDTRPGIQPPGDMDFGGKPGTPPIVTPPPTITIPIEGGADVTIPDFSRPQPPTLEPPMSIGRPVETPEEEFRLNPLAPPTIAPPSIIQPPVMAPPMQGNDRFSASQLGGIGNAGRTGGEDEVVEDYSNGSYLDFYNRPQPGELLASIAPPVMPSPGQRVGEPSVTPYMPKVIFDGPTVSMEEAQASAIANGVGRSLAPPVQSVTTPKPIAQAPRPVQEPVEMTAVTRPNLNGEMQTVNIGNYNLPAGPTAPTAPASGARQIPSGPAMGGISAVPTPAAPPQNVGNNPPPMSIGGPGGGRGGIFGAPMFAAGGDTDLPNEGLEALSKTEKGREAVEAMGYQEGGQTDMMQDPVTQDVIMFILGETDNENAINAFVEKYGAEQFMFLRDKILKQAAGNPDAQTEGLIQGQGNSGMADDLPGVIGNKEKIAVSQDEFIVPADVVSMLGDGSSDAGSKQLYNMMDRVRQAKTGGTTQAPPLNPQKVLPA